MPNKIVPYRPDLKEKAKHLRKNSTLSEILLWEEIKDRRLGYQFHRQVPMLQYIVDFYSHELGLAIEVDGDSHDHKVAYDQRREQELKAYGVTILRFEDIDVKRRLAYVVQEIYCWIEDYKNKQK
ncbi:endonuclease domain-containing protein [Rufibacter hautae]|uniref:Endonuclease domain-containing protein n=1 Tax=Rufibacter hautae TaxID=2595005 RepID=A0A5B6TIB9_9BACT|nr:endonuclease domain-containing protein [Rufibacter hautae]KAA3439746.1 endonuclease domain-containing protein [Rufibacter hautae]